MSTLDDDLMRFLSSTSSSEEMFLDDLFGDTSSNVDLHYPLGTPQLRPAGEDPFIIGHQSAPVSRGPVVKPESAPAAAWSIDWRRSNTTDNLEQSRSQCSSESFPAWNDDCDDDIKEISKDWAISQKLNSEVNRYNKRNSHEWLPGWDAQEPPLSMDNIDFFKYRRGKAKLIALLPDDKKSFFYELDVQKINEYCPLFAHTFEVDEAGRPKASIDVESDDVALAFLRFCYCSGQSYLPTYEDVATNNTCSLLFLMQLCRLAKVYNAPQLAESVYTNIICLTNASCSNSFALKDLCSAITYMYEHLCDQDFLIETVIHYCATNFAYHKLGSNEEFLATVWELPAFATALNRENLSRGFVDDGKHKSLIRKIQHYYNFTIGAQGIIQLESKPIEQQHVTLSLEESDVTWSSTPTSTPSLHPQESETMVLPMRPKIDHHYVPKTRTVFDSTTNDYTLVSGYISSGSESDGEDSDFSEYTLVQLPRDHPATLVSADTGIAYEAYDDDDGYGDSDAETVTGIDEPSPPLSESEVASAPTPSASEVDWLFDAEDDTDLEDYEVITETSADECDRPNGLSTVT